MKFRLTDKSLSGVGTTAFGPGIDAFGGDGPELGIGAFGIVGTAGPKFGAGAAAIGVGIAFGGGAFFWGMSDEICTGDVNRFETRLSGAALYGIIAFDGAGAMGLGFS